ncbi:prepilin-type N-terminal cleavage/methylation domain-containing protein [Cohnella yongneupensis]|uniref:Prepilin-type N-terminal cleavage/methylation domain-containing protein n=1 Tax=Cohnella yongneupensis TaxID=425006 RepID=A0ABW0R2G1_9BACL
MKSKLKKVEEVSRVQHIGTNREEQSGGKPEMKELFKKRKGILGNQNGLTLIELLAVIVILAIISAIAIPAIGGIINSTKTKTHEANALLIIDAARYYSINAQPTAPIRVSLAKLNTDGFLEDIPLNPSVKGATYDPQSFVFITKTGEKYSYAITLATDDSNASSVGAYITGYGSDTTAITEQSIKIGTPATIAIPTGTTLL